MYVCKRYVTIVASVRTNVTAAPIPAAVFIFFDTPRNGQRPKNWLRTTLLTREELIRRIKRSFTLLILLVLLSLFLSIFPAFPGGGIIEPPRTPLIPTACTVLLAAGSEPGSILSRFF